MGDPREMLTLVIGMAFIAVSVLSFIWGLSRSVRDRQFFAWLKRIEKTEAARPTIGDHYRVQKAPRIYYEPVFPNCCFPPRCHRCGGELAAGCSTLCDLCPSKL